MTAHEADCRAQRRSEQDRTDTAGTDCYEAAFSAAVLHLTDARSAVEAAGIETEHVRDVLELALDEILPR